MEMTLEMMLEIMTITAMKSIMVMTMKRMTGTMTKAMTRMKVSKKRKRKGNGGDDHIQKDEKDTGDNGNAVRIKRRRWR